MDRLIEWLFGIEGLSREPGSTMEFVWSAPPWWFLILVLIPGSFLLFSFLYRRERADAGWLPRTFLAGVRTIVFLLVCAMLFGPALTITTNKRVKQNFILLLDESLSMTKTDRTTDAEPLRTLSRLTGIGDPGNLTPADVERLSQMTRAEIARRILQNQDLALFRRLEDQAYLHVFAFGAGTRAVENPADLPAIEPEDRETAIGEALKQALAQLHGQGIGGIIVITDGRNNSGQDPADVALDLGRRRIPVYTIAPGYPRPSVDIDVRDLQAPEAVIVTDQMNVRFKVVSDGVAGISVPVETYLCRALESDPLPMRLEEIQMRVRAGGPVERHDLVLLGGGRSQDQTVTFSPQEQGLFDLIVYVPPRDEETTGENNFRVQRVRVADDKVRVLYVDHRPRWEFRFLRNALLRDPKIRVQTLLTSADRMYPQPASGDLQPLTTFPEDMRTLVENYDVIVLGDVPLGAIGGDDTARMIHDFVYEHGGGLILQTGRFWNPVSYRAGPLEPAIPAVVRDQTALPSYTQPLQYLLEADGVTHPIARWSAEEAENRRIWTSGNEGGPGLPPLLVYFPVDRLKPAAIPLVSVRDPQQPSQTHPLFAFMMHGRGRVFVSLTDETWRWRYLRGDYPYFYPFWQHAIYWTRQGTLLGLVRLRIETDKTDYVLGEEVHVFASAWDSDMRPIHAEALTIFAEPPSGDRVELALAAVPAHDGAFSGTFRPDRTGEHRLWGGDESPDQRRYTRFSVFIPNREEQNPILDVEALRTVAGNASWTERDGTVRGGRFVPLDELESFLENLRGVDQHLKEQQQRDLWNAPIGYLAIALLLTIEWVVRKVLRML